MVPLIVFGIFLLAGGSALAIKYWDKIKDWARRVFVGIKAIIRGAMAGNLELIKIGWNSFVKQVVIWEKTNSTYIKHIKREEVDKSEIPDDIREKLKRIGKISQSIHIESEEIDENDIPDDIREQLDLIE